MSKEVKTTEQKTALELLEEDDEFEEFEGGTWNNVKGNSEDKALWQDDWEDEDTNDEFVVQLRQQIEAQAAKTDAK